MDIAEIISDSSNSTFQTKRKIKKAEYRPRRPLPVGRCGSRHKTARDRLPRFKKKLGGCLCLLHVDCKLPVDIAGQAAETHLVCHVK
jgi:hypothetical protein